MSSLIEKGRDILFQQPFSHFLGTQLTRLEPGFAELRLTIQDVLKQQDDMVHNGVVSYMADNALSFASKSLFAKGVNTEYKISFLRDCSGDVLIARATARHIQANEAVCHCDIYSVTDKKELLCATAQGLLKAKPLEIPRNPFTSSAFKSQDDSSLHHHSY